MKAVIERSLRWSPPLYRLGSRAYHAMRPGFRSGDAGTPLAVRRALALASAQGTFGDYYEFGLFRGYSFLSAYRACCDLGLDSARLWGFDSFAGLPSPEGVDSTDPRFFRGQFRCGRARVERNLTRGGIDWGRASLIEGFYDQTLTEELKDKHNFGPPAVVLLDCDLHSSTACALRWLAGLLVPRTILIFDDWTSFGPDSDAGQPRAFAEFTADNPQLSPKLLWDYPKHGRVFSLTSLAPSDKPRGLAMSPALAPP